MNRVIVAGGLGFFGSNVVRILRAEGNTPLIASRRAGSDIVLDVEDRASIQAAIRQGDVIVDATAPFQKRTATLVDEAIAIGTDIVDLSDSLAYATLVSTRDDAARKRGVRVLNSCSAVSVVSAFAIERSGIQNPAAIHGFLAPATRHTANKGAMESLLATVHSHGWSKTRRFAAIHRRGRLIEMADTLTLPRVYPTLRDVDFWVDPNIPGANQLLGLAARMPALAKYGLPLARFLGSKEGILAYEIEGAAGEGSTITFTGSESYLTAAIPAALAAVLLASGASCPAGIVPVNQHVKPDALSDAFIRYGITQTTTARP